MSSSSGVGSGTGGPEPRLQDEIRPRELVVIMEAVGDKFKAIPITDLEQRELRIRKTHRSKRQLPGRTPRKARV